MFSAIIVSPQPAWRQILQQVAVESGDVIVTRMLDRFPSAYELTQLMNAVRPDIAFLDLGDPQSAVTFAADVKETHPRAVLIGFGAERLSTLRTGKQGIDGILPTPLDVDILKRTIDEAVHRAIGGVQANLLAFLPSKAGSGCSTVVLHTASALVGVHRLKVLVVEGDLRSGALSIFLNCVPEGSVQGSLKAAQDMDVYRIPQCITTRRGIDFLFSDNTVGNTQPTWVQYFQLLETLKDRYDWILVDLPELVNPATVEVVRRVRSVYIVCTPELASLKLALRRCQDLEASGVEAARTGFVLNRCEKRGIGTADAEEFLGPPIGAKIPNDYKAICAAVVEGAGLAEHTAIWRAFAEFGGTLTGETPPKSFADGLVDKLSRLLGKR